MGRYTCGGELAHDKGVDPVVGLALLCELGNLGAVECAGVVPEMHHQSSGIVRCIDGLRFAAIELLPFFHSLPRVVLQYLGESAPAESIMLLGNADPVERAAKRGGERRPRQIRQIVVLRKMRREDVLELRIVEPRQEYSRRVVVQMAEASRDALLERVRVVPVGKHSGIMI